MTKKTAKQPKNSKLLLRDSNVETIIIKHPFKNNKKRKNQSKKKSKKQTNLQKGIKFQNLMIPKNSVDQIRLTHITSKLQQLTSSKNEQYLIRIKQLYDQYKILILKYTSIPEIQSNNIPQCQNNYKLKIIDCFVQDILNSLQINNNNSSIPNLQEYYSTTILNKFNNNNNKINQSIISELFSKFDYGGAKLKLEIKYKQSIQNQLKLEQELNNQKDYFRLEYKIQQQLHLSKIAFINQLHQQQIQEIVELVNYENKDCQASFQPLFKQSDLENAEKSILPILLAPSQRPNEIIQNNYFQTIPKEIHNKIPINHQQSIMFKSNLNKEITPLNAKKTLLVQDRPVQKQNFFSNLQELNQFNYQNKQKLQQQQQQPQQQQQEQQQQYSYQQQYQQEQLKNQHLYQQQLQLQQSKQQQEQQKQKQNLQFSSIFENVPQKSNNISSNNLQPHNFHLQNQNQNQHTFEYLRTQMSDKPSQFSHKSSESNIFDRMQFSNLYKSSLQASTINNDLNNSKLFNSTLSKQTVNWVFFINDLCPFKFPQQIMYQSMKLACVPVDQQIFDDYEYVIVNDQMKILILEQREIMTSEIHMKLNRNDDQGAIKLVTLKLQYLTQQFMLQYNNKQVILLLQYENQFFYYMLQQYVFPNLQIQCEQFQINMFSQFDELKQRLFELLISNYKLNRPIQINSDFQKIKRRTQSIDFHELLKIKCLNQIHQTLLSYI